MRIIAKIFIFILSCLVWAVKKQVKMLLSSQLIFHEKESMNADGEIPLSFSMVYLNIQSLLKFKCMIMHINGTV